MVESDYWHKLQDTEFIAEPNCWQTCNSFCCRWNHPAMSFKIIPPGGTLFYMDKELSYMQNNAKVLDTKLHKMSLNFADKQINIHYMHCNDCDNCNILFNRTLYCKLYPFLPIFDVHGNIHDVKLISVYDITMDFFGDSSPCGVLSLKNKYLDLWKNEPERVEILKEPYVLFHLLVAAELHSNYSQMLASKNYINGKDRWARWEMDYLMGKLVDKPSLSDKVAKLHSEMNDIYGDFF